MDASLPGKNPNCAKALPNKDHVPVVLEARQKGTSVGVRYEEHGAKVVRADLIYTLNGGQKYEEWFRAPAKLIGNGKILVQLPEGTTHYFINLTDENGFLVSYPELKDGKTPFNQVALTTSL